MLSDRALLRLSGEGVREFLQGLVTSNVAGDLPVWAGLLTPQGKCLFDFFVWEDGEDLLLDCEAEQADALARRLTLYRLRRPIGIARDETLAVHWSPDGDSDPRLPALGKRWLGAPGEEAEGYLEHRLRLGVCEGVAELGDLLWLETNAAELTGVDFKKGCFVGQENTARMNWRQKINRRLFVVEGDGEGLKVRAHYPELGLAVVHGRAAEPPKNAIMPSWLKAALPE
ncbi:folate-binding protein [Sphingomicrobium sp. B8]|uniref:Folate-binding protein n=2 Tax=Sphingomicrobium clamense TaxID=2851013 RepID=A0ABS6V2B5_9SPHN|nr:folate-binding protein [Sphingomicrobium sp. B8]